MGCTPDCLKHVAHGAAGIAKAILHVGLCSEEVTERRREVCRQCAHASRSERCRNRSSEGLTVNSRCYWCGCVIAWKTTLDGEKCPLGKW